MSPIKASEQFERELEPRKPPAFEAFRAMYLHRQGRHALRQLDEFLDTDLDEEHEARAMLTVLAREIEPTSSPDEAYEVVERFCETIEGASKTVSAS